MQMQMKHALAGRPSIGLEKANAFCAQGFTLRPCDQSRRLKDFTPRVCVHLQKAGRPPARHDQSMPWRGGLRVQEGDDGPGIVDYEGRLPSFDDVGEAPIPGHSPYQAGQETDGPGG